MGGGKSTRGRDAVKANDEKRSERLLLGFCVLPSTPECTRKVPRSGKFARWALRRCYAGDVTVMNSGCLFVGGKSPRSSSFVRMCGLLSSVELGRTLFKWARFTRSAIEKLKSLLTLFVPALYSVRIST